MRQPEGPRASGFSWSGLATACAIAAAFGAVELWFYEFSWRRFVAAAAAGAVFMAVLALLLQALLRHGRSRGDYGAGPLTSAVLPAIAGAAAGGAWWFVAQPEVAWWVSSLVGGALGFGVGKTM